jgi:hypothetical protein
MGRVLDTATRRKDRPGARHTSVYFPREVFDAVVIVADQEGRTFSQQVVWMLRQDLQRRNGG